MDVSNNTAQQSVQPTSGIRRVFRQILIFGTEPISSIGLKFSGGQTITSLWERILNIFQIFGVLLFERQISGTFFNIKLVHFSID